MRTLALYVAGIAAFIVQVGSHAPTESKEPNRRRGTLESYERVPLSFEENRGQSDDGVRFLPRGPGYVVLLAPDEIALVAGPAPLHMRFSGASRAARLNTGDPLGAKANYFIGDDPRRWLTGIPLYAKVALEGLYPGAGLVLYGSQRQLTLEFSVGPGSRPESIRVELDGVEKLGEENGELLVETAEGAFRYRKAVAWQTSGARRQMIDAAYALSGQQISFILGSYDPAQPLVLSSVLEYAPHVPGNSCDGCAGVASDGRDGIFVTGATVAPSLMKEASRHRLKGGVIHDVFAARLNAATGGLDFVTFVGGSDEDAAYAIGIHPEGEVSVTGSTSSTDFPIVNAFQTAAGGGMDAFVVTLGPDGVGPVFSTYVGGSADERARGLAVDPRGDIHVAGWTRSPDFPTVNALQARLGGGRSDAFTIKLHRNRGGRIYATLLGGSGEDQASGIAADAEGNTYLNGWTRSYDFPVQNAIQTELGGGICGATPCADAFVAKLDARGSALVYSTYLGGSLTEFGTAIAVDLFGNSYVTGSTYSADFPTRNPLQAAHGGGARDAFVAKLNAAGSALLYSTYLGGSRQDYGTGIAVDSEGGVVVSGSTDSRNFPIVNALQPEFGGGYCGNAMCADAFVARIAPSGSILSYSTHLGGNAADSAYAITAGRDGAAVVVGNTRSHTYPGLNPLLPAHSGNDYNLWLMRVAPRRQTR